jgi:phosphonate transport system substrate-binding protein
MIKIFSILACLIFLNGCSNNESKPEPSVQKDMKPILIGLVPEQNIFDQLDRYQLIADYLKEKTGINVEFKMFTQYGNVIDDFEKLHLDGAFLGSFSYVLAHIRLGLDAIARPQDMDGLSTYCGLIFVRKDSGFTAITDMKGKSFAFVDKATMAGYLLPLAYFKRKGIQDYKAFFKETYFAGSHDNAIYDVLNKRADMGAAKSTFFSRLNKKDTRVGNELQIIETSPEVPETALALKRDLEGTIKEKIKNALLEMHNSADGAIILNKFGAKKFIETLDDDYLIVYKYVEEIGLDLSTYDYNND